MPAIPKRLTRIARLPLFSLHRHHHRRAGYNLPVRNASRTLCAVGFLGVTSELRTCDTRNSGSSVDLLLQSVSPYCVPVCHCQAIFPSHFLILWLDGRVCLFILLPLVQAFTTPTLLPSMLRYPPPFSLSSVQDLPRHGIVCIQVGAFPWVALTLAQSR
mmetsp:Transcript_50983/g.108298  ORF Transcript_50983/g.108298 Transcript_50983/m.108298 type:complete len:159 (-) Transcript_50983:11-487(-)